MSDTVQKVADNVKTVADIETKVLEGVIGTVTGDTDGAHTTSEKVQESTGYLLSGNDQGESNKNKK
jgi:hypothetical protein